MASSAKDIQLRELKDTVSQLKTMIAEQTELIKALPITYFLPILSSLNLLILLALTILFTSKQEPGVMDIVVSCTE